MGKQAANPLALAEDGRGTSRGPLAGAYHSYTICKGSVTGLQTNLEVGAVSLRFPFRIESV